MGQSQDGPQHRLSDRLNIGSWVHNREENQSQSTMPAGEPGWDPVRPKVALKPNHFDGDKNYQLVQAEVEHQEPP